MARSEQIQSKPGQSAGRRRFIGGLASGLAACGFASPAKAQSQGQAQEQSKTHTPADHPVDRVTVTGQTPIVTLQTWIDLYGRPTAEVRLNGQGPFRFVVDTGSNTSVLSPRVAASLGLQELPMRTVHGVTGSTQARFARIDRIETGRSVSNNLSVAVMEAPALDKLDGILGMDMFANRRIRFNFTRKTVDLEPASSRKGKALPITSSIRLRHGLLIEAEGKVAGVRAKCVLDTGGDTTIINMAMLNALSARARRRKKLDEAPVILGVTNQQLNGVWASLPNLNLIGVDVRRLTVVAADAPVFKLWGLDTTPAMLVGMDVLSQAQTLVIDYRRRQVELQLLASLVGGVGMGNLG